MNLYNKEEIKIMDSAEAARIINGSRIEEIKSFARLQEIKRIGIANCVMFAREAEKLKKELEKDFEVYAV